MPPTFEELGVPAVIRDALEKMRYETPTPVQASALPRLLNGEDTLVEAETGSGKTAAFGIVAVKEGSKQPGLRVLVLVPTRELARQVADEIREIGTGSPFRAVAVTGGVHAEQEERALGGDVRCIVATPGRLLALHEQKRVRLDKIKLVVVDEADRMLDMGFKPDVEKVLAATSNRKQTAMLSATLPPDVVALARSHMARFGEVRISGGAPASLDHYRLNVFKGQKEPALIALLRKEAPERAICFVETRKRAAEFTKLLKMAGFPADALQGEMTHEQRRHVFDLFQRGISRILVATDIAARGLDVPEMQLVVNVDVPTDPDSYSHRSGRAGRMGRGGKVVTFVLPDEKDLRLRAEREEEIEMQPMRLEFSDTDLPKAWVDLKTPKKKRPVGPARNPRNEPMKKGKERTPRATRQPPRDDLPPSRRERRRD